MILVAPNELRDLILISKLVVTNRGDRSELSWREYFIIVVLIKYVFYILLLF